MADQSAQDPKNTKRPYLKPELVRISLRPEEAVLGNCKNTASAGPLQSRCNSPAACSILGS